MLKTGIRFSLRDKRLFEITEVEITRVDCNMYYDSQHIHATCLAEARGGKYLKVHISMIMFNIKKM